MRLCSGQWDVKGSDPTTSDMSSKKEPLVLSFSSPFLQADMEMLCCLLQPWARRELPRERAGQRIQCHENLHSTRNCGNVFFGGLRNGPKIRHPSALRQAGLIGFGIQRSFPKSPDSLFESSGNSMLRAFTTCKHPSRAHTGRAESSEEEICKRTPARLSPARGASHRPAIRPADLPDLGVSGPWGIRGTSGLGSPPLERPDVPGGRGLWGPVTVRGQLPSQWPRTATPCPKFDRGMRRQEKRCAWPSTDAVFDLTEERRRGKGFPTLNKSAPTGRGRSREGAKRGRSPSLPKGSRFLSPSIRLNLGLSRRSRFQWPVASSSRDTLGVDAAVLVSHHEGVHGERPRARAAPAAAAETSRPGGRLPPETSPGGPAARRPRPAPPCTLRQRPHARPQRTPGSRRLPTVWRLRVWGLSRERSRDAAPTPGAAPPILGAATPTTGAAWPPPRDSLRPALSGYGWRLVPTGAPGTLPGPPP